MTGKTLQALALAKQPRSRIGRPARQVVRAPRLSVVVVNYCQWDNTAALVRQIARTPQARRGDVEVIVVDNHSPPHHLAAQMRRWPGVSVRRWGRNRGFARAVNEGIRISRGQWLLLLNPDTAVGEGFIESALAVVDRFASTQPRAGIIGLRLLNVDGTHQLSTGPFPTLLSTLTRLLLPRARRKYQAVNVAEHCRVPWVTGCGMLVRRECFEDLGGLDEAFFLYYEDVDLCRRAEASGWSVWHEPELQVTHHQPLHSRVVSPALRLITRHSLLTYALRHWAGWQWRVLTAIVRVEALARTWRARSLGDKHGAKLFREMGHMARDMASSDRAAARRRLRHALQSLAHLERGRPDGHCRRNVLTSLDAPSSLPAGAGGAVLSSGAAS